MPENSQLVVPALLVSLCAYFLVTMEWIFFVTKPSFLNSFTFLQSLEALFIVAFASSVVSIFLLLLLALILLLVKRVLGKNHLVLLLIIPSLLLLFCTVLLVDNFSNTVFGYGVAKTEGIFRLGYLLGFCFVFYRIFQRLFFFLASDFVAARLRLIQLFSSICLVSSLGFLGNGLLDARNIDSLRGMIPEIKNSNQKSRRPNIIFFAADGIGANLLSGYGNNNKTTPNLDRLLGKSLVAENAFTNAERTTGSITSMLTGKYPATTQVLFPPHVLKDLHAYQHLPGILKRLGYSTFQESVRYYADANDLNFLEGFDWANGTESGMRSHRILARLPHVNMLARKIVERISQRLKHLFWIENMPDVYSVIKPTGYGKVYDLSDESRVEKAIEFIQKVGDPFFIHLHLMDTHCCNFKPKKIFFSTGKFAGKKAREKALLEDLLKASDEHFEEIVEALRETDKLKNTVIVYSSDHADRWEFRRPVPLVFIFPDGDPKGKISNNAQLLDVAPTILDYINIKPPKWMEGESLLIEAPDPYRPIYGITKLERGHFNTQHKDRLSHIIGAGPPNYGLKVMGLVVCDTWYTYQLANKTIKSGIIKSHSGNCERAKVPGLSKAKKMLERHLQRKGFIGG